MTWMKNNRDDTKNTNANLGCADNNTATSARLSERYFRNFLRIRARVLGVKWLLRLDDLREDIQRLSKQLRKNGGNAANRSNRRDDY